MSNINIEKLLNIYNYFDGIIITDEYARIQYYSNFNTDIYDLQMNQIIGKTILEIHPDMTEEDSTIYQVLKTGMPIYNHIEHLITPHGDTITNICSTLPIRQGGKIVGAIDYSRGIDDGKSKNIERHEIILPEVSNDEKRMYHVSDIITTSREMNEIINRIPQTAVTDSPVMIYGETGTGKEMIAESIHTSGNRSEGVFISQNCAAIPESLLEATLFGTVKGAFTGAMDKRGLFEIANGGTVFLDELNSMSKAMQAKILKAVEEQKVRRIGSDKEIPFDVKVISALNRNPIECVDKGILRSDLFYRLSTVLIEIPPLRNRLADIPLMTNRFIAEYNRKMNKKIMGVSDDVRQLFFEYKWPGNVRELKNCIEGAFNAISGELITIDMLPSYLTTRYENENKSLMTIDENLTLREKVEQFEKQQIIRAIDSSQSLVGVARKLKISKQALNYKLLKYGLKK